MSSSSAILFVIHIDGILPTLCEISAMTFTSLHLQNFRVQMTLHWVQELNALINMHLKSSPSNKRERDSPCVCVLIDGGENRNHKPGQGGILYYNIEPLEFKESGLRMITFHYMCGSLM